MKQTSIKMRKRVLFLTIAFTAIFVSGCGNNSTEPRTTTEAPATHSHITDQDKSPSPPPTSLHNDRNISEINRSHINIDPNRTVSNHAPYFYGKHRSKIQIPRYHFFSYRPKVNDPDGDRLIYTIQNLPSWADFNHTTGVLSGYPTKEGHYSNITIHVSDGNQSIYLPSFSIEVDPPEDIAFLYGRATEGTPPSYRYYRPPSNAIDHDPSTINVTSTKDTENWLQIAIPEGTKIHQINILNRQDRWADYLKGATLYILSTPYQGSVENLTPVATLTETKEMQTILLETPVQGNYILLKGATNRGVDVASVEVYGQLPLKLFFKDTSHHYHLISHTTPQGEKITTLPAVSYQRDTITYQIIEESPFSIDNNGTLVLHDTTSLSGEYNITIQITDGILTSTTSLTVEISPQDIVDRVLRSGDVTKEKITERDLIMATRQELQEIIYTNKKLFQKIYRNEAVTYDPTRISQIITPYGDPKYLFPALYTQQGRSLALAGEQKRSHFLLFASNPFYLFYQDKNLSFEPAMERWLKWLTSNRNTTNQSKTVVFSYVNRENTAKEWIEEHFPTWNVRICNDSTELERCYEGADMILLGNLDATSDDAKILESLFPSIFEQGIAILYIHPNYRTNTFSNMIAKVFRFSFAYGGNYYKRDKTSWDDATSMLTSYVTKSSLLAIDTIMAHFQKNDYDFDWTQCASTENCTNVDGYTSDFLTGANKVRSLMRTLDSKKEDIFNPNNYQIEDFKLYKLYALVGDILRQSVTYPLDKNDQQHYFRALYADHALYNYRKINPPMPNMGNFSRSDFSDVERTTIRRAFTSKKPFRSAGVYVLPGETIKVTRTDKNQNIHTKIFINSIRDKATHIYKRNGYNRPKYLQSAHINIESNETIYLTHAYGGTIQIECDRNEQNISFSFEHVAQHPVWAYWMSNEEKENFISLLNEEAFDWAEVITPNFELHSKLTKMKSSINNTKWDGDLERFLSAIERYTSNYPNAIAGYKGPGITTIPEVEAFAQENNLTIYNSDFVKHMNADQATCGYGCSGNPYDAYWAFDPVGHGDLHEIGHGLEKSLFRIDTSNYHSSTNGYSYYTQSIFNKDHEDSGISVACQSRSFKNLFNILQQSQNEENATAYLQNAIWTTSDAKVGLQLLFHIEAMMLAQHMDRLEDGWDLLAILHILERDRNRIKADWENRKHQIGFTTYTLDEFNHINHNDWLVISYSFATKLDYRPFFDMYGIQYSQKASEQVAAFGYDAAPKRFFVSTPRGYCTKDEYGDYLDKEAIDLNDTYPE